MKLLTSCCLLLASLATTVHAHNATPDIHPRKNTSHAIPDIHTRKNTSHAIPDIHTRKNTTRIPNRPEPLRMATSLTTPDIHTRKNTSRIPDQTELLRMANSLATNDTSPFFSRVAANVIWDVLGTHQAAGHYTSLASWRKNAFGVIQRVLEKPLRLSVRNVIGGRPQSWAVLELEAHSRCKNGLHYDQDYAWVMKFNEEGMIVHVRSYLDSVMVQLAIEQNT